MFDLILRGGRVFEGTGSSDFRADVAVENGRIAAIGQLSAAQAREIVDVTGLTTAPGFIDVHSHSDGLPFATDPLPAKILQGVTTEVNGNCGSSPFPVQSETVDLLRKGQGIGSDDIPWNWTRLSEYAERLEEAGPVSNIAPLVGHNALRIAAMGFDNRVPTTDEMATMQRLLAESLDDGAFGLSTGLIYPPGVYAQTDELIALASVMRSYGRPYVTHPRGETHNLFNAIAEALTIGEKAKVPVEISHLKAAGRSNYGRGGEILTAIEAGRARGIDVTGDVYPYDFASGHFISLLPPWCHEGGRDATLERLTNPDLRRRIAREFEEGLPGWVNLVEAANWDGIRVVGVERKLSYLGKSLQEIADEEGTNPAEVLFDLLVEEKGRPVMTLEMMYEPDVRTILAHPLVMIGSDALIMRGAHPRTWATFPRVLGRYSRDLGLFSQAEAIRKMTSYPAQKFGIRDRGLVLPGLWADLVVFDAPSVLDTSTSENSEQAPLGMPHVLVNGKFAVRDGLYTGIRAGKVLRP